MVLFVISYYIQFIQSSGGRNQTIKNIICSTEWSFVTLILDVGIDGVCFALLY